MEWPDLTGDLQAAADRCADGVVEAILAGRFSPVVEQPPDWDDFAELFHRGAAASLQDEKGASA
jgi:ATP-dependent helicase/nuclease subunit B